MGKSISKVCALMLVIVFIVACVFVAKPISATSSIEDSWVEKAQMNHGRVYLGVAAVDDKIYAIGGCDLSASGGSEEFPATSYSGGITGANEEYDPVANNWTLRASMPTPRQNFGIAAYQNKIFCIGGSTTAGGFGSSGANEVYDPFSNTWEHLAPMPIGRTNLQANVVDGKIYCIGGLESNGHYSKVNEVYDPATNTWSTKSQMPNPSGLFASAVFDNKIYVIGGWTGYAGLDLTQIYNPKNDSWSSGAPPPVGENCAGVATSGVMAPERIYCFSGRTQIYDPVNDSWSLGTPMPFNIGGSVTNVNDKLYVIGGVTSVADMNGDVSTQIPSGLNQQYTPLGYGTPDPSYVLEYLPPQVSLLSPLNQTYKISSFPLNLYVNKAVNRLGYSLDGKNNMTIDGNTTISGVSNGKHTITVYANDTHGNVGASQTISFIVAKPESFSNEAPVLEVSIAVAFLVVLAGIVIYLRKKSRSAKR